MSLQPPSQQEFKWNPKYSHPLNELLSVPHVFSVLVYCPGTQRREDGSGSGRAGADGGNSPAAAAAAGGGGTGGGDWTRGGKRLGGSPRHAPEASLAGAGGIGEDGGWKSERK